MQRRGIAVAPPFERQLLDMFARCDDRGIVSWGAGIHACLGRQVAPIILAEAVRALAQLPRL